MTIHDFDMVRFYLGNDEIKEIFATAQIFRVKNLMILKITN